MEKYLRKLKRLEGKEHIFGKELINAIQYSEESDGYAVRVGEYPPVFLMEEDCLEDNYIELIGYLTKIKSRIFNQHRPEDSQGLYYSDWLAFKINYNAMKAEFYRKISNPWDADKVISFLSGWLGRENYNVVMTDMCVGAEKYRSRINHIFMYLGTARAIRDLTIKYLDNTYASCWAFHLWNLTPTYLTDKYGYIFYLGNELSSLEDCPYDYVPREYYYHDFYMKVKKSIEEDVYLSKEQKEKVIDRFCEETGISKQEAYDFDDDV